MTEADINKIKKKYEIVGNCDGMNHAIKIALKIAPVDLSVLVIGENGSGKEIFSHIIHDSSKRSRKKLMAINCGAIPEGTIDSEPFWQHSLASVNSKCLGRRLYQIPDIATQADSYSRNARLNYHPTVRHSFPQDHAQHQPARQMTQLP